MFKQVLILALVFIGSQSIQGVVDLNDQNFNSLVQSQPQFWIVLFAADWCGHCQRLKPEFEKLSPMLADHGVKLGLVNDKSTKLINDYVVDHKTHMVSYPKLKVFLGEEMLGDVPPGLRSANEIKGWFLKEYGLAGTPEL